MNTNCLVTKLKSVVDNNQLLPIGYFRLRAKSISGTYTAQNARLQVTIKNGETCTISTPNGGYFALSFEGLNANRLTTYTITANSAIVGSSTVILYFANADYDILISNKYNIRILAGDVSTRMVVTGDINDLKFSDSIELLTVNNDWVGELSSLSNKPNLTELSMERTSVYGNINSLQNNTRLTRLVINRATNIYGNIDDLGKLTSLVTFFAADVAGIGGTIDGFVAGQINSGKTTSTTALTQIFRGLSFATFNGHIYGTENSYCYVSWESASKIAVYAGADGYTNCPRVYCKGYTQEEAESKWSGKTIIRVDA